MLKSIKEIVQKTNELKQNYKLENTPNLLLKELVIYLYGFHTLRQLDEIFNKYGIMESYAYDAPLPEDLLIELKTLLEKNWELICDTFLAYTALPKSEITGLLCNVAETLAFELNQKQPEKPVSSLNLLVPNLSMDSLDDKNYPHLVPVNDLNSGEWIQPDLLRIFETHIFSEKGLYLIPVRLFCDKNHYLPEEKTFENPYYDYTDKRQHDSKHTKLSNSELERLIQHSSATRELNEARNRYENYLTDTSNLLGRLHELCHQLRFNSADFYGKEFDAARGAYPAIINFMKYYQSIQSEIKKIPQSVHIEIELLLELSSDSEKNRKGTEDTTTCIARRRHTLETAMKGNEALLASINLNEEDKQNLIDCAKSDLKNCEDFLNAWLDKKICSAKDKAYTGVDKLPCTLKIIQHFGVHLEFSNLENLELIKTFTPDEMRKILQNKEANNIARCFKKADDLVLFAYELNVAQCESFFESLSIYSTFWEDLLFRWQVVRFSDILEALDPERCKILALSMKKIFVPSPYYTESSISLLFRNLNSRCRKFLYPIYKNELLKSIYSASEFNTILSYFDEEIRKDIYDHYKNETVFLETSAINFKLILEYLDPSQREEVFNLYKKNFKSIIKDALSFKYCLDYLSDSQREEVYEQYKKNLNAFINNSSELCAVLRNLSPQQCLEVCQTCEFKLLNFLEDSNFVSVVAMLPSDSREKLYIFYVKNIRSVAHNIKSLNRLISPLSLKELEAMLKRCVEPISQRILSAQDYKNLIHGLYFHQGLKVFSFLKPHLVKMVSSTRVLFDLHEVLQELQFEDIYRSCITKLPKLIESAGDLNNLLLCLNEEQKKYFFTDNSKIFSCITTIDGLDLVLRYLNENQKDEVFSLLNNKMHKWITSAKTLYTALYYFNFSHQLNLLQSLPPSKLDMYFQDASVASLLLHDLQQHNHFKKFLKTLSMQQYVIILKNLFQHPEYTPYREYMIEQLACIFASSQFDFSSPIYLLFREHFSNKLFDKFDCFIKRELINELHRTLTQLNLNSSEIIPIRPWLEGINLALHEVSNNSNWNNFLDRCKLLQNCQPDILLPSHNFIIQFFKSSALTLDQKVVIDAQKTLEKIISALPYSPAPYTSPPPFT